MHELGHNLGLPHASYLSDQYGDLTDVMGYCCKVRCFAAPNTHRMHWTTPRDTIRLPWLSPHSREYTLLPSEYILVQDDVRRENTYIQLRVHSGKKGYDKDIPVAAVYIYILPTLEFSVSQLQETLLVQNQVWQNVYAGLKVTLKSISPTSAHVLMDRAASSMSVAAENGFIPL